MTENTPGEEGYPVVKYLSALKKAALWVRWRQQRENGDDGGDLLSRFIPPIAVRGLPVGSVIVLYIIYEGNRAGTIYTYAAVKAPGGRWFLSGTGKTPQDAGWGAVLKWLSRDGRILVSAYSVEGVRRIDVPVRGEGSPVWPSNWDEDRISSEMGCFVNRRVYYGGRGG